jgi:hypothetical protein
MASSPTRREARGGAPCPFEIAPAAFTHSDTETVRRGTHAAARALTRRVSNAGVPACVPPAPMLVPAEVGALIIAAWLRGKMLPKDAIEQMVPLPSRKLQL